MSLNNLLTFPAPSFSFPRYFLSVGQFLSILRTSIDSNGLPTDGLLAVGTVNFPLKCFEKHVGFHIQTRKPQGDFRGTECILQMLSQEEQEHRGKNFMSVSGWVVQDCLMQNRAAGPQWVWSKAQATPWPVVRE